MNTLEQLEIKASKVKDELNALKMETLSVEEKKKKAEKLKQEADTIKTELQQKINELNAQNDASFQSEKEKAEQLLDSLEQTTNLYNDIVNNTAVTNQENIGGNNNLQTTTTQTNNTENSKPKEKEKGFFGKTKDWVGDQWNDIWDEGKWKDEKGKNLLRTAGFVVTGVGAVSLAYKGIKKLFGIGKNEEDEEEEETSNKKKKKKKGFRKRPFGKFLKWTAIGVGGALGINWLGKQFGWRGEVGATGKDSDKDKYESYDEFVKKPENKEKFENYEGLGGKVDNVYQEINGRELKAGYEDELEMKKISVEQSKGTKFYKGIVPYCLDNQFKNVDGILGQNSSFKSVLNEGLEGMIGFVKNTGGKFLKLFSECYLEYLPSRAPFKGLAGSLSDKIDQWKRKNKDAEKEMQYFFRQSIRVQTYLSEKKDQLIKKLVKEASLKYGISEDDIWNDQDKFEKFIAKDPQYQNYMNSPTHGAVTVLAQHNLFDDQIDEDLKKHVAEIDESRDKILGCNKGEKDILETIYNKKCKNEALNASDDKKLGEACDGVIGDMDNIIEATEERFYNIYEDLLRIDDSNLREFLAKSGLDKRFLGLKQILLEQRQLLKNGNLDNDKKIALAETLNSVLAYKKEAILGEYTIKKEYDERGNIIYRIPGFLIGSMKNVYKGVCKLIGGERLEGAAYIASGLGGTGVGLMVIGGVLYIISPATGKVICRVGKGFIKAGVFPAYLAYKGAYYGAMRVKPIRDFSHKINPLKYKGNEGAKTLLRDLREGRISLERAGKIINRKTFGFISGNEKVWKETFGVTDALKGTDMRKVAFDALIGDEYYLRQIKDAPDNLYDDLIKQFDSSKEVKDALLRKVSINELKTLKDNTSSAVDTISAARKAFNTKIDKAIDALKEAGEDSWTKQTIKSLKKLQNQNLLDEEMTGFVKFMDNGLEAKHLPGLRRLLNVTDELQSGEKIGAKIEKLLSEGDYDAFKKFLQIDEVGSKLEKVGLKSVADDISESVGKVFKKLGGVTADAAKSAIKGFIKIVSKLH